MNSAIAKVLNKVLGDFVEGLSPEQLNLSVFSGEIQLTNLRLKKEALQNLGLPFKISAGHLGKLFMKIPWTSLATSPLQVEVENVYGLISPQSPTDWSEDREREASFANRSMALENFEALNSSLDPNSSEPGYFEKLISKIIDNVFISVKNIYLRYEDEVTSTEHFAAGVFLKEMKAQTCNSNWQPEFVPESKVCFKLVAVNGLGAYLDYGNVMLKINEDGETLEQAFDNFARLELTTNLDHRFVLSPMNTRIELILSKDTKNFKIPEGFLNIEQNEVNFAVHPGQLTHVLKLVDFIDLYQTFKKGVERNDFNRTFSQYESQNYREIYKAWKQLSISNGKSKDIKKLKQKLDDLEQGIEVEIITQQRNRVLKEIEIKQKEESKRKEIGDLKTASSSGTVSKLKGWFGGGKSQDEKMKEQQEKDLKIKSAELELDEILKQKEQNSSLTDNLLGKVRATASPLDWIQ